MSIAYRALTAAQRVEYLAVLASGYGYRVRAELQTQDGRQTTDVLDAPGGTPPWIEDGQVDVDFSDEATRTATVKIFDPGRDLSIRQLDIWAQRRLALDYEVLVPSLGDYVTCPIGRLPLTGKNPSGPYMEITAANLDLMARGNLTSVHNYSTAEKATEAIRRTLHTMAGFRLDQLQGIPTLAVRLQESYQTTVDDTPWSISLGIAQSINYDLWFQANGVCHLRKTPTTPVFDFIDGTGGTIIDAVHLQVDYGDMANMVIVNADLGEGEGEIGRASAPVAHPFSARNIGQNGVNRTIKRTIQTTQWQDIFKGNLLARRELNQALQQGLSADGTSFPIPFLEPHDCVTANTKDVGVLFNLDQFSLPLVPGNSMTFGRKSLVSWTGRTRTVRRRKSA